MVGERATIYPILGATANYPIYDDFSKGSYDFQVKNGFVLGNYPLRCFFEITGYSSC